MTDRRGLLARIHILKKELAIDDAGYRELLQNAFGVASSALLDDESLAQLAGIMSDRRTGTAGTGLSDRNRKKTSKKIWAAWFELRAFLPPEKRSAEYLCGIARKNAPGIRLVDGILDFDLIPPAQADGVIRSLLSASRHERSKMADVPF